MFDSNLPVARNMNNIEGGKRLYLLSTVTIFCSFLYVMLYHILQFKFYVPSIPCIFRATLHLYCPGCGGTRSLKALLDFDFIRSFLYNPFILYLILIALYYYIGSTVAILTKFKIIPFHFKYWMLYIGLALFIINCIIKNIIAVYYGIDYLGDIYVFW